jgi:hypothetical protein
VFSPEPAERSVATGCDMAIMKARETDLKLRDDNDCRNGSDAHASGCRPMINGAVSDQLRNAIIHGFTFSHSPESM